MQYQNKETKLQDNKNLYIFIGLVLLFFIAILGFFIYYVIRENSENSSISNYINVEYDPISGDNYENIDQEQQGEDPNATYQYLGFGPLYDAGLSSDEYAKLVESINLYTSENMENVKFISLSKESVKKDGNIYYFTIYFNSEYPTNVELITKPEFIVNYSS